MGWGEPPPPKTNPGYGPVRPYIQCLTKDITNAVPLNCRSLAAGRLGTGQPGILTSSFSIQLKCLLDWSRC
jgi:hypothetical protein